MRLSAPLSAAVAALLLTAGAAHAQKAEDAFGVWLNPENGTNIEMYKCAPGLCAKVEDDHRSSGAQRGGPAP